MDRGSGKPIAIVIGAGPAGLSLSLGLSHRGWKVILVEKYESFEVRGASFGMAPNGTKALEEIHRGTVEHGMIASGRGMPLPGGTLVLPWWMMRDALLERVREMVDTKTIDLKLGLSVEDILDEGGSGNTVKAKFTNGTVIEGDLLIGTDGVHSSVRKILGLPPNEVTGNKVFRGTIEVQVQVDAPNNNALVEEESKSPSSDGALLQQLLQKGIVPLSATYVGMHFFVLNFNSHIPGRMCWVFSAKDEIFDPETTDIRSFVKDHEKDEEKLAFILAVLGASADTSLSSYTETKVTDFSDDVLSEFSGRWGGKGKVTIIGDAAHAMRPTDGQGGNMAFEDAIVLCRLLGSEELRSAVLGSSSTEIGAAEAVEDVLGEFEKTRLPRVKKMHDNQRLRYEARMRGEKVGPMSPEFKEWASNGV